MTWKFLQEFPKQKNHCYPCDSDGFSGSLVPPLGSRKIQTILGSKALPKISSSWWLQPSQIGSFTIISCWKRGENKRYLSCHHLGIITVFVNSVGFQGIPVYLLLQLVSAQPPVKPTVPRYGSKVSPNTSTLNVESRSHGVENPRSACEKMEGSGVGRIIPLSK